MSTPDVGDSQLSYLVNTDASGQPRWVTTTADRLSATTALSGGGLLATGHTTDQDAVVVRHRANGALDWRHVSASESANDIGSSNDGAVAFDNGDAAVAGHFAGAIDLAPGRADNVALTSAGHLDGYVVRFRPQRLARHSPPIRSGSRPRGR
jgi:hypothetical protein